MLRYKYFLYSVCCIFFICFSVQSSEGESRQCKYPILGFRNDQPDYNNKNIHPLLSGGNHGYIAVTVQENDILKVAFYEENNLKERRILIYTHNPSSRSFSGMPARYISEGKRMGILFADGTELYEYLPLDARPLGTPDWMYQMRWRRIYENYYLVTVFRGSGRALKENIMTEKTGKDLMPVLGDTSEHNDFTGKGGSLAGDIELGYWDNDKNPPEYIRLSLIPIYEHDLPPDFPEGMVCWIP